MKLSKHGIRVVTVKPGFVQTKMTESLNLPKLLTSTPNDCAKKIYHSYSSGPDIIYIGRIWWLIMLIVKLIPEKILKDLNCNELFKFKRYIYFCCYNFFHSRISNVKF